MKNRNVKRAVRIGLVVCLLLLLAPFFAGYFQIGDRDGPVFYPEVIHTPLYIIGHEAATGIKPRERLMRIVFYDRPLFWGMPHRLKSEAERSAFLRKLIERHGADSPWTKLFLEEQQRIEDAQAFSDSSR